MFPPNDIVAKCVTVQRLFSAAKMYRIWLRLITFFEHVPSWKFLFASKFSCSNIGNMTHFPPRIVCRPVSCEGVCRIYFGRVFRNPRKNIFITQIDPWSKKSICST